MTAQQSARHALPFLMTAQAQKEITHNEALVLIDALLHPVVQEVVAVPPTPDDEDTGKCWLVAEGATGVWSTNEGKMACWVGGSWRFLQLPEGARIFDISGQIDRHFGASGWLAAPEIAAPSGGAVADSQAREVIELLLEHFRAIGVVAAGA